MAKVLVFSETVDRLNLEILSHLSSHDLEVVTFGFIDSESIKKLKKYGVRRINLIQYLMLDIADAEIYSSIISDFIKTRDFDYIFTDVTQLTKDLFPRLSAIFESALVTSVIDFKCTDQTLNVTKSIFAGQCLVDVEMLGPKPWLVTVEAIKSIETKMDHYDACDIVELNVNCYEGRVKLHHIEKNSSKYPALKNSDIIVSGGRGLRDSQDIKLLEDLAGKIGASVGVSLGAVESGIAPRELLIGQSGNSVTPSLYIACGISGAVQHMAGLRNAKKIMAINSDKNAPIMRIADYAVVGDLYKILPKMTDLLNEKLKDEN